VRERGASVVDMLRCSSGAGIEVVNLVRHIVVSILEVNASDEYSALNMSAHAHVSHVRQLGNAVKE
jgi:hypothetical protein